MKMGLAEKQPRGCARRPMPKQSAKLRGSGVNPLPLLACAAWREFSQLSLSLLLLLSPRPCSATPLLSAARREL